jgi:nitroreductase
VRAALSERFQALPAAASGYIAEFEHYATFFSEAPVLIAVLHKLPISFSKVLLDGVRNPELVSGEPLSAAMAVQTLLLAAHTLRLGTCMLTAPLIVRDTVARQLAVPPGSELTCLVALGHPAEQPEAPRRKNIEQIAEFRKDGA